MPHPTEAVAVRHPETGQYIALDPGVDYDPSDLMVKTFPWAFAPRVTDPKIIESVSVEQATAAPGEKRSRTRAKK
jgi:hypothetical protein